MRNYVAMIALFLIFSTGVFGQGTSGRTASFEIGTSPFVDSEALLTPSFLKARYFFSDFAARLSIGTDMLFVSDQENNAESVKNLADFEVRPGIEYHISASENAIPFIGIDFIYASQDKSFDTETGAPVDGAWDVSDYENSRGFNAWGVNLVAGGDYFIKGGNFYVGAEVGFEFLNINYAEVKWNEQVLSPSTTKRQFKPTLSSMLRIGVAF